MRLKVILPNYGVFDEKRVFAVGPMPGPVNFRGVRFGLPICEDIWGPEPAECIAETGGEILLVLNGSPYRRTVLDERLNVAVPRINESGLPMLYANQVGGQDELVFDGASFVLNADASLAVQLPGSARSSWSRTGSAERMAGAACRARSRRSRRARRPTMPPACSACATTSTRTGSKAWCWGFPAASIRRSAPRWRSMRSGPIACTA